MVLENESDMIAPSLLQKYNVPVPRYTSYPTVPLWENNLDGKKWTELVKQAYIDFGDTEGISLYIHLPYCESLCTYCGCNKRITKNHSVELPYVQAVLNEWQLYLALLPTQPKLAGIHLGGGTPTFFSPEVLTSLITAIRSSSEILPQAELSFEGHPNNTTLAHLEALHKVGFRRVSYGIQDVDEKVQKTIHRIQPFAKVKEATDIARKAGYDSFNFDLIYGLPHQNLKTIEQTFHQVNDLRPERIAFYSYAHVPSAFPAQKSFEAFLPQEEEKRALYDKGKELLLDMGYYEIGMDHFSLPDDPLFIAKRQQDLHRNFMGYTTSPSRMLIGLGNSSISDVGTAYAQNQKDIDDYKTQIERKQLALNKGHVLTKEDAVHKRLILDIICNGKAEWNWDFYSKLPAAAVVQLEEMTQGGLLKYNSSGISVCDTGKAFVRNICAVFDQRMQRQSKGDFVFSKAV